MELRQLRHFVAAVECGNLSAAAERVLISQPALSRSIKSLEDHLGAKLLERLPRGVVPTSAGQAFFRDAKFILNECRHVREELKTFGSGRVGSVRIGTVPIFATHILPAVLAELTETMPRVDLSVVEGLNPTLIDQLLEGELDLVLATLMPSKLPRGLVSEALYTVSSIVAVGASHPAARKKTLTAEGLTDARWVFMRQAGSEGSVASYVVEQHFAQNDLPPPKAVLHTTSLTLLKDLVQHHGFASMLPDHMVAREIAAGTIRHIHLPSGPFRRPAGLIYREASGPRPLLDRVLAAFRGFAKNADPKSR